MPRTAKTWIPGDTVASSELNKISTDLDTLFSLWDDRLELYKLSTDGALVVRIGAGVYRVWTTEGQYVGGTVTVGATNTTYVMIDSSGAIQTSTSAWNTNYAKIWVIVSSAGVITSIARWANDVVGWDFWGNPTWVILVWPVLAPPTWYLTCDGSAISRSTYAALFSVLSTTYGNGDGSTTFNLPNLKSRIPLGLDTTTKFVIDNCDAAWTAGSNVVATNDTGDKKEWTWSVKLAVAAGATANQILGYKAIGSLNLSTRTTTGLWIKSDIAIAANDLQFRMDDTAALASPLESLNIPALLANQWTKIYLPLANPSLDTAIISVGIYQVVDKGAFNLWIDDINGWENYEIGATGWETTHVLATAEIPGHTHTVPNSGAGTGWSGYLTQSNVAGATTTSSSTGGGTAHNNLQPFVTMNYIIKA